MPTQGLSTRYLTKRQKRLVIHSDKPHGPPHLSGVACYCAMQTRCDGETDRRIVKGWKHVTCKRCLRLRKT